MLLPQNVSVVSARELRLGGLSEGAKPYNRRKFGNLLPQSKPSVSTAPSEMGPYIKKPRGVLSALLFVYFIFIILFVYDLEFF